MLRVTVIRATGKKVADNCTQKIKNKNRKLKSREMHE
ncbi:uncharacterized protein Dmoj_GI26948 [Drosophila mojavensis]|uniref:Uncharacterized protein n=1 Tax=Drosophila mojavensis TaxID=7230 RepID=A0A0Q9X3H5_DROMO|nr:uncharacterized protein Dmoj_GI26948 [Drosophila mojavensis]